MADVTPKAFFPNVKLLNSGDSVTEKGAFIPLTDLKGLTEAEANPDTGDGREFMRSVFETSSTNLATLSNDLQPTQMTLVKGALSAQSGEANTVRQSYSATFDFSFDPENVTLTSE